VQFKQQNYSATSKLFYAWFEAMHTRIDIAISAPVLRNDLVEICTEMEAEVHKYERIANRFDPQSELSWVNTNASEKEMPISSELYDLLKACEVHNTNTLGYFDVSVYSAPTDKNESKPYILDASNKTVKFTHSGALLDLSGFLKGYVLNKLIPIINTKDLNDLVINVGNSSIYARGNHPFGQGWKIKIPDTQNECVLKNECLTTSGNTNKSQWKIINPLTKTTTNKKPISVITKLPDEGEVVSKVAYLARKSDVKTILKKYNAHLILEK
jgi:thiamine biosynthesis lipoprotein